MRDDDATFEPLDKLDILKEEMAKTFKGMDKNLGKLQQIQGRKEPIANAKPRMKSMMDDLSQGVLDIRPFVPKSFTLFHGIADILQAVQAPANAQMAREIKEADRELRTRQSESIIGANNAYTDFLEKWKMPPDVAASFTASGIGNGTASAMQALPAFPGGSPARPPGPASVVTPPYAGVLAGGTSGGGSSSGGSELRDILAVLREILEVLRQNKSQGEDEDNDEDETVENRRPFFKKREQESERPKMEVREERPPTTPPPSVTRPPQQSAAESISTMTELVAAARMFVVH